MNPRPRSIEQFAGAYAFEDRIVIVTYGLVAEGELVQAPVCFTVNLPAKDEALGYGVIQALETFLPVFTPPPDPDAHRKTQLKAMGVRTERELQRYARHCLFYHVPGSVGFQPMHNGGHKGEQKGFQPMNEAGFTLADSAGMGEIGAALREAFKRCTTVFE